MIGGGVPFTSEEFVGVFALYNRTFVVVVVALWLASAGMVAFVSRDAGPILTTRRRCRTRCLPCEPNSVEESRACASDSPSLCHRQRGPRCRNGDG